LTATLTPSLAGSTNAWQPTLQFAVAASTNALRSIQLFSTGGLIGVASNQPSATFTMTLNNLDVGAHPFYAIVTDNSGHQYRTQTQTVNLISVGFNGVNLFGVDLAFPLKVSGASPTITWPATAGRAYNLMSTTNVFMPFQLEAVVVPTSSLGQWTETNAIATQRFYQVSVAP
jgi:hypothetical protein